MEGDAWEIAVDDHFIVLLDFSNDQSDIVVMPVENLEGSEVRLRSILEVEEELKE